MRIKHISLVFVCFLVSYTPFVSAQKIIVNDFFPSPKTDASYFGTSSKSNAMEVNIDKMTDDIESIGLVSGKSGRQIHALFETQTLSSVGDTLSATIMFTTPATTAEGTDNDLRIGLFDHLERTSSDELGQHITATGSGPNPVLVGLPGIVAEFDVDSESQSKTTRNIQIRQSAPSETGRLLGTTKNDSFPDVGSSSDLNYQFTPNSTYEVKLILERVDGSKIDNLSFTVEFSIIENGGLTLIGRHKETVTPTRSSAPKKRATFKKDGTISTKSSRKASYSFGMLAMGVSTQAFGSKSSSGDEDNGIDIISFFVETDISKG